MRRTSRTRAALAACALALAACATAGEEYVWRHPDGSDDPEALREDVAACEAQALVDDDERHVRSSLSARPWGGWGDPVFEFCMRERGWRLTRVGPDGAPVVSRR
jgi:hypothetical protein